jgi:tRNA (cytidine32/uridine32-2'-O)-methyltransferase
MLENLNRIRVVLVNTSHPGNIGAVARAMKNMGLTKLTLVAPELFPHAEATARASGADDILAKAEVVATLDDAIAPCQLVIGASARSRTISWPTMNPREAAEMMLATADDAEVAVVMGRENSGLSNAELEKCNYLVHIPANPQYSSLNIAAATQVLVYELRMVALSNPLEKRKAEAVSDWSSDKPFATAEEMEAMFTHYQQALTQLEFLDPDNPRQLMRRLRRLYGRTRLDQVEVNILRGILTSAQKALKS